MYTAVCIFYVYFCFFLNNERYYERYNNTLGIISRTTGDKRTLAHMSQFEDSTTTSARLTPTKYSTCHVYGKVSILFW